MRTNNDTSGVCEKFGDKSFINFLKVFLNDLLFRSVPVTHNPPQKLSLSDVPNARRGSTTYYKLKPELSETNVFITRGTSFEWEPDMNYGIEISKGSAINNQKMDKLSLMRKENDASSKRDATVKRTGNNQDEVIKHKDIILGLTCCIRLNGKRFNITQLPKFMPNEMYEIFCNQTECEPKSQILIDRTTIICLLWAIAHMRKPSIFDSISKSLFKEYFESTIPIEAQNLIYILALGKRLQVLTPETIESSMQNLSSPDLLNSLSVSDLIIALSCMDNDKYQIVTKIMNLVVEQIDGMDMNLSVVCLSTLVYVNASPKRFPLSYRKILTRIDNIFSSMPVNYTMSHLFHLLCQIPCDMKGFFESISTKVIRIMHLLPITDMVRLMCAIAIYERNCEKARGVCEDSTRIPSYVNLENHVISQIRSKPPFPKELLDLIHDSIIFGSKFIVDEEFSKLLPKYKVHNTSETSVSKSHSTGDLFKSKNSVEVDNRHFELSSEERFFFANLLEDCCTNINQLESDVIVELVYSLLTFKVDMKPLGMAVKRLVDESVLQEINQEEMGFSVNLSSEMSDVVSQYRLAESIISYANRGKQVREKFDFTETQKQLESAFGIISANQTKSSEKPLDNSNIPLVGNSRVTNEERAGFISKILHKSNSHSKENKESDSNPKESTLKESTSQSSITKDTSNNKSINPNQVVSVEQKKRQISSDILQHKRNFSKNNKGIDIDSSVNDDLDEQYRQPSTNALDNSNLERNKSKRDERKPNLQSRHSVSENAIKSNLKSGHTKSPVYNTNEHITSDKNKSSVFGTSGERLEGTNNNQYLHGINNSMPIPQTSSNNHPQYSTGVIIPNHHNQSFTLHPQFSNHSQGLITDSLYSIYPQYSKSPQHQIQHQMYLSNQNQNQLHGKVNMIGQNQPQAHRESMYNPAYGNYPNYYTGGISNNMNILPNNVHMSNNNKNMHENIYNSNNEQVYQGPTAVEGMSNIRYNSTDAGNPHISSTLPNPNYEGYNQQHFLDPLIHMQHLATQQQNITHPRHDNDCFPNPTISDLKNQIHLIELEIEKERLKELERKLAFMNN